MNLVKGLVIASMSMVAVSAMAGEDELAESRGRWTVRAGYSWRARAKTDFRGSTPVMPAGGTYENGFANGYLDWQGTDIGSVPAANPPGTNGDGTDWSLDLTRNESACGGSDDEGMHGVKFGIGYDFYSGDYVTVALLLDFSGYWHLENSTQGGYCRYTDSFRGLMAPMDPVPTTAHGDMIDPAVARRQYLVGDSFDRMRTKLEADLYQIGIGPQVTWHAFSGWCDALEWIDVYGGVEALCNIIDTDFTAGGASTDETNCRIGFGGQLGLVGNVTDWWGIYGQVGYEWIDEDDVSTHGCRAETDYSSLILSAGIQFRF